MTDTATEPTADETPSGPPPLPPLDLTDRCDRCRAQAFVRTDTPDGTRDLLWCAHHHREHGARLAADGFAVTIDQTDTLRGATA